MNYQRAILCVVGVLCFVAFASARDLQHTIDRNVYVFGTAFEDTGAFYNYYGSQPGRTVIAGQPISPPTVYYGAPLSSPRIEIMGPLNRFSNGRNWVDFYTEVNALTLANSYELSHLPAGNANLVNFAIAGSTVNGNLYNTLVPNSQFSAVVGAHGFDEQVNTFVNLKNSVPAKTITPKDIVIISILGGNDVGAIVNTYVGTSANSSVVGTAIATFSTSAINSIQALYDNGVRKMIITYADPTSFGYIPFIHKASPSGVGLALAQSLSTSMWSLFTGTLNSRLSTTMPALSVDLIPLSALLSAWVSGPELNGLRRTLSSDIGDPRPAPISFPFPTFYDMSVARPGLEVSNAFAYTDVHLTEHSYQFLSKLYDERTLTDLF